MKKDTRFQPGTSGNPAGRKKGIKDRRVLLRELFKPHAADLIGKAIELAMSGDTQALRLCLDRTIPPIKEDPIQVNLPAIKGPDDCADALSGVLAAVAAGDMLPSEAKVVADLIDSQRRAYETGALADRLANIERLLEEKGVAVK